MSIFSDKSKGFPYAALKSLKYKALIAASIALFSSSSFAQGKEFDAAPDYIKDCKYATCVGLAGVKWSEKHPFGVAVSVRMGTQPVVTDDQIKMVLTKDFKKHGITEIKFFFEQNDTPASGIYLHVRGGTEGIFLINTVREEVATVAARAKNRNPALLP